ncbi:hypothetical protein QWM81_13635 [Streptomyces ficellus]|uniref:Uncharacterized protein n=1 Tax=Streptomyces ficellus TaxID=1977088 RepID=A0ABT7Z7L9_9ACTN|nr:hypothetical protein [Streptomyces ficellus]MDN3295076.1 hypothetical protein [Streptomyces ficellus]
MEKSLQIHLSDEEADPDRLHEMTEYLRQDLLQLDVDDVTPLSSGDVPPDARAMGVVEIGALLVSLGQSATVLRQVVVTVHNWWSRCRESRPSMRLTMDGDVLEISEATPDQVANAFELFITRHSAVEA